MSARRLTNRECHTSVQGDDGVCSQSLSRAAEAPGRRYCSPVSNLLLPPAGRLRPALLQEFAIEAELLRGDVNAKQTGENRPLELRIMAAGLADGAPISKWNTAACCHNLPHAPSTGRSRFHAPLHVPARMLAAGFEAGAAHPPIRAGGQEAWENSASYADELSI